MKNSITQSLNANKSTFSIIMIMMLLLQIITMTFVPLKADANSIKLNKGYYTNADGSVSNFHLHMTYPDIFSGRKEINGGFNQMYLKFDGRTVFCVEPGVPTEDGLMYTSKPATSANWNFGKSSLEEVSRIIYHGYAKKVGHTNVISHYHAATQVMIWEAMGGKVHNTNIMNWSSTDYFKYKKQVMEEVKNHAVVPSFNREKITLRPGESVTLQDTNGVFKEFKKASNFNENGLKVTKSGNNLTITANANSKSTKLTYQKYEDKFTTKNMPSLIYYKPDRQTIGELYLSDPVYMNVDVEVVSLGELEIIKRGNDTDKGLQGAEYDVFEGDKKVNSVKTDENGKVVVKNLEGGKKYKVVETKAPTGYTVDKTPKTIEAKAGDKVSLTFTNEAVLGKIEVTKTDDDGNLTEGVVFDVKDKDGKVVDTITTGKNGKAITKELPLGNYTIVEKEVPSPLIIDRTPIPVELKYKDQTTPIVKANAEQVNKIAKGKIELTKVDYKSFEGVDGATYGLYTPKGELVMEAKTENGGKAVFENVRLGSYYVQEIEAPKGYVLDTEKYNVTIEYKDAETAIITSNMEVEQRREPVIGTTASFTGLDKEEPNITTLVDVVKYENLIKNKEYTVTGKLMDGVTGEPIIIDGKEVTGSTTFVAESIDGKVEVEFTFDQSKLKTNTVVVFEDLYHEDTLIAVHHDIKDKKQTVEIPKVGTSASFEELDKKDPNMTTLIDVVEYTNLIPGKEYTVDGVLMNKETGEPIIIDGKEVTGSTTFTAEKSNGKVEVKFTFDQSKLESRTVVVFEDLYDDDMLWAVHHDINDEDQTVEIPEVGTSASFVELDKKDPNIATLVDVVEYKDLIVGEEYTVNGVLMDKETDEPILIDGEKVTGSTTFTAEAKDGVTHVEFTFDKSKLETDTVVVFEDLYNGDRLIAVHHDINDKEQTVEIPDVGTKASFVKVEESEPNIVTLEDVVHYENLIPGKEYTVEGILMDKETGEPIEIAVDKKTDESQEANGEIAEEADEDIVIIIEDEEAEEENENETIEKTHVTGSTTFTPEEPNGSVVVEFTFDKSQLETKTVVVFEDLYQEDRLIAVHHDINDEEQTVEIPEVGTTASFVGLDKEEPNMTTLVDVVAYEGLVVGKEYTVTGHLMDKVKNEPILINDKLVTGKTTFTAEKSEGTVEVTFTFDQSKLETDTVVVFEDLYDGENLIAVHHDINDEEQTVEIPEIGTEASFTERDTKETNKVTIVDIVSYDNLIAGKEYTVDGVLMDKESGKPIIIDGKEITGSTTFTPEEPNGSVEVAFTFDQSKLKTDSVVVFEDLHDGENLIAVHHDINDEAQTVDVIEVEVLKTASDSGKKLRDAEFTMYDLEGNVLDVQTTNKKGIATFEIMDGEEVVIKETKAPQGYKINEKQSTQQVKAEGEKITVEVENERVPGEPLPNTATDVFNMALIGLALLVIAGGTFFYIRKRKLATESNE